MARFYKSEVVDDSEPEREELRIQARRERRRGLNDCIQSQGQRTSLYAAETLDGQGPIDVSPSKVSVKSTDIELTQRTQHTARDTLDTKTIDDAQNSTEEDEPKISLARFAYPGSMTTRKTPASTGLTRQVSTASSSAETKPLVKRSAHRFAAQFSDSDLRNVTKCVSCDIRWTARKTAAQKMLHIQSCVKKKGLTDETVQILLRKEIEFCVGDTASHKGKGKEKAVDPQTFFEEVLAETAPKRKARRTEVRETVKTTSQTRNLILQRARAIIAPASSSQHNDAQAFPLHAQILGASESPSNDIPPYPTQAFGNSALAQARQTARKLFDYDAEEPSDNEDRHDGAPSNSSIFAPSRLGRHLNTERHLISPANHLSASPSTSVNVINGSSSERVLNARTETSPGGGQPQSSLERDNGYSVFLRNRINSTNDSALDNYDAFLHFDPVFENLSYDMLSSPLRTKPESALLKVPPSKTRSRTPGKSNVAAPSIKTKGTPSKRVKTTARTKSSLDDETVGNLELKLKDKILEDTDLHLRILRYEASHDHLKYSSS
ncbi:hypothetical protein C0995_005519 [Termitomyces sp. Mi166|nr:hypothetical protein C0995_005519 [Termitomyces sp. Mi166\